MPRAVPDDTARRRRERLQELIDALGEARGQRVTQREFAGSIGREQGTIAAILGQHRALGGDVMMAVAQVYGLPVDFFDRPLRYDPRPFARAMVGVAQANTAAPTPLPGASIAPVDPSPSLPVPPLPEGRRGLGAGLAPHRDVGPLVGAPSPFRERERAGEVDAALGEVIAALQPDRAVAMSLEALARRGVRLVDDEWVRLAIGAQSAHDHGVLVDWYDRTVDSLAPTADEAPAREHEGAEGRSSAEPAPRRAARRR